MCICNFFKIIKFNRWFIVLVYFKKMWLNVMLVVRIDFDFGNGKDGGYIGGNGENWEKFGGVV